MSRAEGAPPRRLAERPDSVHDEETAAFRIKPAPDQIIEQRLDCGGVLRGSFDDARWVFLIGNLNADSPGHQQTVVWMPPVDPDRHKVRLREIRSRPLIEFGLRQRLEPPGYRGSGQVAARLGRNTGLGQPNGATELAGGHIHRHRVLRPLIGISTRRNPYPARGSGISCPWSCRALEGRSTSILPP